MMRKIGFLCFPDYFEMLLKMSTLDSLKYKLDLIFYRIRFTINLCLSTPNSWNEYAQHNLLPPSAAHDDVLKYI